MARRMTAVMMVLVISLLTAGLLASPAFADVGVRPLVIDRVMRPGDQADFELVLTPGNQQQAVDLNLFQPLQLITGSLTYQEGDPVIYPPIDWVRLEEDRVVVRPGEDYRVQGTIAVPFDAAGSHTVVVMVEPEVETAETGITFRVRYAVRINITVDRPGIRPQSEVADFELARTEEGRPELQVLLRNPSPLSYDASMEVTIRDETRRLVQRVPLATVASRQSGRDSTHIYPGAEVQYTGEITEPLFPGTYELRLFVRYADGVQMTETQAVTIEADAFDQADTNQLRVDPQVVSVSMRPGGAATQVLTYENRTSEPLHIQIGAREIGPEYRQSIFETLELQYRGDFEVEIPARGTSRAVLIVRSDRETDPGGYYGYLDVYVTDEEEEVIQTESILLQSVVQGDIDYTAQVGSVHVDRGENEDSLFVDVLNDGPAHIQPTGMLYVLDEAGTTLRTFALELEEGVDLILPERAARLTAVTESLPPSASVAEVVVRHDGEEIGRTELPLTVEE